MQVNGKVYQIGQTETVGSNGFTKRQIVVETDEQYPQKVAIDFVKDKCGLLDKFKTGQNVTVDVNLRGSEYNGKFYVNLQGWKINANDSSNDVPVHEAEVVTEETGGLPF